jgi:hypothetical protein
MVKMGLLIPVMELYIPAIVALFYGKAQRNKIREMELKREAVEVRMNMKNFIIAYIKMALQKMGIMM